MVCTVQVWTPLAFVVGEVKVPMDLLLDRQRVLYLCLGSVRTHVIRARSFDRKLS